VTKVNRLEKVARKWLETPFVHQASVLGQGADCLGFVRGVWTELHFDRDLPRMDYAKNWFEETTIERLYLGLSAYLIEDKCAEPQKHRITLFRLFRRYPAQHVGITLVHKDHALTLIHSIAGHGVVEVPLSNKWRSRIVTQFRI